MIHRRDCRGASPDEMMAHRLLFIRGTIASPCRIEKTRMTNTDVISHSIRVPPVDLGNMGAPKDKSLSDTEPIRHPFRVPHVASHTSTQEVVLSVESYTLRGTLRWSGKPRGVVVFANGSGNSRHSPRNRFLSTVLTEAGFATVLMDLLMDHESEAHWKADEVELLVTRLSFAVKWLMTEPVLVGLPVGVLGDSTASAAALIAAASQPGCISAIVSRGGRTDLAWNELPAVQAPTMLLVGGSDESALEWNRAALGQLTCPKDMFVIPGVSHLFEEGGALERVAQLARMWFTQYLATEVAGAAGTRLPE